jgi:HK97 family phage major capsid protein
MSPALGNDPARPAGALQSIQNYRRLRNQLRQRLRWDGAQGGYVNVNPLTTQTLAGGGALIPEGFATAFETALLAYGYMLQVADVMTTPTAAPLPWPTANDTSNKGRRLNQNAAVDNTGANTAYPTFGAVVFYAYKYTSDEILVPFELIRDNAVGLVEWLGEALGIRIGRVENDDWTNGTGADQPKGIVTACTVGKTAASATAIKWDEVIDLEHSVDPAYRNNPGVGYMCHDGIIQALRKLKDGEGRYLWQMSANSGEPDRLNARPITRNQSMQATVATGKQTLLFGDLTKYKIRRVGSLRMYRLVERYRDNDQDAFLAFEEADGNLIDAGTHPVKSLKQA